MTYQAVFTNKYLHLPVEIDSIGDVEYIMPMEINDVVIETNGFEVLTIDNPERYLENQLTSFDYKVLNPFLEKDKRLLELSHYRLDTTIPILLREKKSHKEIVASLLVSMVHDGYKLHTSLSLFKEKITFHDMEKAMQSLQIFLQNDYSLLTCSNCCKSSWNPYGGIDFINQLCFKKNLNAFQSSEKNKSDLIKLMDNADNYDTVPLTYHCSDFEPK